MLCYYVFDRQVMVSEFYHGADAPLHTYPSLPPFLAKKIFLHTHIVWKKIRFLVSYKVADFEDDKTCFLLFVNLVRKETG